VKAPALLAQPRPAPSRLAPVVAGGFVVLLALPVFVIAGWRLAGWALAAVLWLAGQALGLVLARLRYGTGNLAASGVLALGMMFRGIAVMAVVFAVALARPHVALAAALVYAAAYTLELGVSLVAYFSSGSAPA
jgi:hypothetical protein